MSVGKEIFQQIKALDRMALYAWGANEMVGLSRTDKHLGGLQFKIRTPKYKRGVKVQITLNGSDLYDIAVIRVTGVNVKVLDTITDIFAEDLVGVLDRHIDEKEKIFF